MALRKNGEVMLCYFPRLAYNSFCLASKSCAPDYYRQWWSKHSCIWVFHKVYSRHNLWLSCGAFNQIMHGLLVIQPRCQACDWTSLLSHFITDLPSDFESPQPQSLWSKQCFSAMLCSNSWPRDLWEQNFKILNLSNLFYGNDYWNRHGNFLKS